MAQVRVRSDESFEHALRRFVSYCKRDGILAEIKSYNFYEKPSEKRKRRAEQARRRYLKAMHRNSPAPQAGAGRGRIYSFRRATSNRSDTSTPNQRMSTPSSA